MRHAPVLKICTLWPLLVMIVSVSAGVQADESPVLTEIPADAIASKSQLPDPATQADALTASATDTEALQRAVEQYKNSINDMQKTHGVYAERLDEELTGLGMVYKNLGQFPEALAAFNRALHINRVNHGLHSLDQLAILEQIIATNTALSDWTALDQNYQYLYWINRRSNGATDPHLLAVIDRLARWHLNAYTLATDPQPFNHLMSANALFLDAAAIIETNYGPYDQRLINPLYGITIANYQMAFHAYNSSGFEGFYSSFRNFDDTNSMLEEEMAIQDLISDAYRTGKQAMLRVIDIQTHNPDAQAIDHGIAMIQLGDWYLLFNQSNSARQSYAMAYTRLNESGMQKDEINKLFEQPRSLPSFQMPVASQQVKTKEGSADNYVLVKFDVSKNGKTSNIEIVEAQPADDESIQRRAKETIRDTRFRPRLEDGQPVATTDINIRYVLQE